MDKEVAYLYTGGTIWTRLLVSLWSLRKHWNGRVVVYCATRDEYDSLSDVSRALDLRRVNLDRSDAQGGASLGKLLVIERQEANTLYLDCDTLIAGDLIALFNGPLVLTYNNGKHIASRTRRHLLDEFAGRCQSVDYLIARQLELNPQMVNAGVWSFDPRESSVRGLASIALQLAFGASPLPQYRLCEMGMQLLTGTGIEHALLGQRWNHPPRDTGIPRGDIRVWHYTGSKHCKHRDTFPEWADACLATYDENVGGLAAFPERHDKHTARLIATERP